MQAKTLRRKARTGLTKKEQQTLRKLRKTGRQNRKEGRK